MLQQLCCGQCPSQLVHVLWCKQQSDASDPSCAFSPCTIISYTVHAYAQRRLFLLTIIFIIAAGWLIPFRTHSKFFALLLHSLYPETHVVDTDNTLQDLLHVCISGNFVKELLTLRSLHQYNVLSGGDPGDPRDITAHPSNNSQQPILSITALFLRQLFKSPGRYSRTNVTLR